MSPVPSSPRRILHLRWPDSSVPIRIVVDVLQDVTPLVVGLPPWEAALDISGSLRVFGLSAYGVADLVRERLAGLGLDVQMGGGPNRMLAALACPGASSGGLRVVGDRPEEIAAFLCGQPTEALPGVGPKSSALLAKYGIRTAGQLAALDRTALQRILGRAAGAALSAHARGEDRRQIRPYVPEASVSVARAFPYDCLDGVEHRRAVLSATVEIGTRLRDQGLVARGLVLTVRFVDKTQLVRSVRLREPSASGPVLTTALYRVLAALHLERARVRGITVRAEDLVGEAAGWSQLDLVDVGGRSGRQQHLDAAVDRIRRRFGEAGGVRPAALVPWVSGG